jgi:hypothetical protein
MVDPNARHLVDEVSIKETVVCTKETRKVLAVGAV